MVRAGFLRWLGGGGELRWGLYWPGSAATNPAVGSTCFSGLGGQSDESRTNHHGRAVRGSFMPGGGGAGGAGDAQRERGAQAPACAPSRGCAAGASCEKAARG